VSARVDAPIYAALAKSAKAQKIKLSRLIESILQDYANAES
jgi:predicted HicB family RNase H-like nuclease